ncbi:MAG: alginate lyase family protein [Bacteroidaceae bacterium]|nr:alginate lyase family protein [Bacteroidaceae bacterium]
MKQIFLTAVFILMPNVCTLAQTDYKMSGPYEVVARDGEFRGSKGGSERDMKAAWDFAREGKHDEALRIINAYAETLQRLDGHDAPLCLIQGYWLCRSIMELKLKIENGQLTIDNEELGSWEAMLRRAMVPTMDRFEANSPYANGNWGAIVNRFRMACAIAIGDSAMYQAAIDYYLHANDNGALPNYVSETGQCQETGRDQSHVQLGLGAMCEICEMAWEQGDDLWGALDNRLMKGIEYTAKYNLGYDVPFETWTDCTGLYNYWTEPGSMGRGRLWQIYQMPYNHYVGRKGLKMPYTKKVLDIYNKALKRGEVKPDIESATFYAPGVTEGQKLHQVFTYPAPEGAPLKDDYDVYIQPRGQKEWIKIDTYMAKVNARESSSLKHKVSEISYCFFDFTGDVLVKVITKKKKFSTARIRPDYRGTIANVQNDSTVQFLLFQPENVSVEFSLTPAPSPNGEGSIYSISDNLLVFTSKPPVTKEEAEEQAKKEGRQFIYIPPGFYDQEALSRTAPLLAKGDGNETGGEAGSGGEVLVPSNTTLYLAGGAYFTGTYLIKDAHDVSILGRGIARPVNGYNGCFVANSKNVLVDGLVCCKCPIGGSDGVTLHDVRSISHPSWGDGLNVLASSNILYDRVFCRNSDDCTTAYATRLGYEGNARNIHMRNSTLWADVAHPIFIGLHGAAAGPHPERRDTIENLLYENIDILGQAEPQVDYQGCLAINCGDNNLVRNVTFDNIRIEQIEKGCILQVKVGWNQKYCKAPGLGIENITFRNIRYYGNLPNISLVNGYDQERGIKNITFEGVKVNGRTIYDDMPGKPKWHSTADYIPMFVGNHVSGLTFTK